MATVARPEDKFQTCDLEDPWAARREEERDLGECPERFRRDVMAGLSHRQRRLPSKYRYDPRGVRLFEAICDLEEYYSSRIEAEILSRHIDEICGLMGPRANLVDFGSGNGQKGRLLLEHLREPFSYCPVDVAREPLIECALRAAAAHPNLEVEPVWGDYNDFLELPEPEPHSGQTNFFFSGSMVGNFEPDDAIQFLRGVAALCHRKGGLLIGVDLKKPAPFLDRACNDSRGVTAEFNLNILARANRELDAGFDLSGFRHHAFYNEGEGRVEMHLVSRCSQSVPLGDASFRFAADETILTEHAYKYTVEEFHLLARHSGWEALQSWTDDRHWFSVHFLRPNSSL